ncbi:MAG TPA: hypothetical protein VFG84_10075 [Gemmatimonadaceae bacterium]|nr:hypothetical protein [Gemmatimonadaceae bacterium]
MSHPHRILIAAALAAAVSVSGPFDIVLLPTARVPGATGHARLVFAPSPFGIAVTADGRARYDAQVTISGLPDPASLGAYRAYVAWAVSSDLSNWHRLGTITNGTSTVGSAELNKFLFVITVEADSSPPRQGGPVVLRGASPSTWLQSFLSHPLFRGIPPG